MKGKYNVEGHAISSDVDSRDQSKNSALNLTTTGENKGKNLDDVLQRMLKVKQRQLSTNHEHSSPFDITKNFAPVEKMIDVQFSNPTKNPISDRGYADIKRHNSLEHDSDTSEQIGSLIKNDETTENHVKEERSVSPFVSSSVLDRQSKSRCSSDSDTPTNMSVKQHGCKVSGSFYHNGEDFKFEAKSNGGTPSTSPLSVKEEDIENSRSPPELIRAQNYNCNINGYTSPNHPSICSLINTSQFANVPVSVSSLYAAAAASTLPSSLIRTNGNAVLDKESMFRTYHQQLMSRMNNTDESLNKKVLLPSVAPALPSEPTNNRTNKSSNGRFGRGKKTENSTSTGDKPEYKRPPHTYPALIASAILDSQGNLITLRGIYDYIMNNFPYYKYCHDKSAWQNSIRHNLSLNQCFVKVPRYENAAKSNFWTMTRDGFEEFGNENSFKRRRRRGAALAPISAYKNKKYNSVSVDENAKNRKQKNSGISQDNNSGWPRALGTISPESNSIYGRKSDSLEDLKRPAGSPGNNANAASVAKHPRMMILKQGEGPRMYNEQQLQRPNSLSSVEEMQGNVNSFTKSLSNHPNGDTAKKTEQYAEQEEITAYEARAAQQQQWIMAAAAAQKTLIAGMTSNAAAASMAAAGMFPPYLIPGNVSPRTSPSGTRSSPHTYTPYQKVDLAEDVVLANRCIPITLNNLEIGSKMENNENDKISNYYQCKFCDFKYRGESSTSLKQHCQILHRQEILRINAFSQGGENDKRVSTAQETQSNNWIFGNITTASASHSENAALSTVYTQPALRNIAQQKFSTQNNDMYSTAPSLPQSMADSAIQRQQLLALLQQAAISNAQGNQDPNVRQLMYQQILMQNPFFSSNPSFQNQLPLQASESSENASPLTKLLEYQKLMEMSSANKNLLSTGKKSELQIYAETENIPNDGETDGDKKPAGEGNTIHSWKQCTECDFRAKGSHGLGLHYRKAHGVNSHEETSDKKSTENEGIEIPRKLSQQNASSSSDEISSRNLEESQDESFKSQVQKISMETGLSKVSINTTISTQTEVDKQERTCKHCDVTFGDDMMFVLHMSCHDKSSPYTCTICGQNCHEKYQFNVHLLRGLHKPSNNAASSDSMSNENIGRNSQGAISPCDLPSTPRRQRIFSDQISTNYNPIESRE